jgi:uncharacterized protein (TIGR02466 family)
MNDKAGKPKDVAATPEKKPEGIPPETWFSTPIWARKVVDFQRINQRLLQSVAELEKETQSITRSNVGGWHSISSLHTDERFADIRRIIGQTCVECARFLSFNFTKADLIFQEMWINKNKAGDFNKAHVHPNAVLSGSYYIKVPPNSGNIEFYDPVRERIMSVYPIKERTKTNSQALEYKCNDGLLIIFPSWLQHSVQPSRSEDFRVSLAFNMGYRSKPRA